MSSADAGADAPRTPRGPDQRPKAPHLQVWRWHVTLVCSILHRATGVGLYGGALILAGWTVALAMSEDAYDGYASLLGSIQGKVVLFGLTVSAFYHLACGIRHLVWDAGKGFNPKVADMSGAACIAFSLAAAIAVWVLAAMMGAL